MTTLLYYNRIVKNLCLTCRLNANGLTYKHNIFYPVYWGLGRKGTALMLWPIKHELT